jgi:carbon storage regulator
MLVLSRIRGEGITIGEGIRITVLSVREGRAKLGIEAPKEIRVVRADAKKQEPPNANVQ